MRSKTCIALDDCIWLNCVLNNVINDISELHSTKHSKWQFKSSKVSIMNVISCAIYACLYWVSYLLFSEVFQISGAAIVCSTVCSYADERKPPKLRVTGLCAGNSPVTGSFPAQGSSNAQTFPFDDAIIESPESQGDYSQTSKLHRTCTCL